MERILLVLAILLFPGIEPFEKQKVEAPEQVLTAKSYHSKLSGKKDMYRVVFSDGSECVIVFTEGKALSQSRCDS